MSKSSVGVLAFVVGLAGVVWLGHRMHDAQQARELGASARNLLQEGVERAPALADIRATEARKLAEEALRLAPSPELQALVEGAHALELFCRGELDRATLARKRSMPALRDMPVLRVLDVRLQQAAGEQAASRKSVEQVLAQSGHDARVLLLAAELARVDGSTEAALALVERALAEHPKAGVLYEQRGLTRELLLDGAGARADYERAAGLDRNAVTPLLQLGRLLHDGGNPSDALFAFRSALQRDPRNLDARMGMGVCRNEIGDRVGARMEFEEAFGLDPDRAEPHLALGDLDLADAKLDDAMLHYRRAVQLDKRSAAAWVKLGNALVRAKAADQATMAFETAIKLSPDLAAAHNGLGAALLASGHAADAETALSEAAALDSHDPNPLLNLAVLRRRSGDERGAQAALDQAKERDPRLALASLTGLGGRRASSARHP